MKNEIDKGQQRKKHLYIFAFFFVMYEAVAYASNDMIMPGMLDVVAQFNSSVGYVASSVSIFIMGSTALQLFLGPASERYGKRVIILIGNTLFLIFTVFIAISGNISQFLLGRLLQGSGCAFIAVGYSIIHEQFDDKTAVRIIALMANVTILSPLFGPIAGGTIVSLVGWRYIFVVISIVAFISFCGLSRYTPSSNKTLSRIQIKNIILDYYAILQNKMFAVGCVSICFGILPLMTWIGLAPVLIMKTAQLSFAHYIIYQIIALSGLSFASVIIQFLAGKMSFHKIIKIGNFLFLFGTCLSLMLCRIPLCLAIGLFVSSMGVGLFNGVVFRIIMISRNSSQSMTMSLLAFIETLAIACGIEIANLICNKYSYSLFSFTLTNFIFASVGYAFIQYFAKMNKDRRWA